MDKPIYFEELTRLGSEIKNVNKIKILALKQLSRGRFEMIGDECFAKILLDGSIRTVVFSNKVSASEFRNQLAIAIMCMREPSLDFMQDKMCYSGKPILEQLKSYQDIYYKLGTEFDGDIWYKLYSKKEIRDDMRDLYQARWINYEKQLENGNVIYDEYSLCGLWAMPLDMILQCFNDKCKNRYGDNLFILKTVSNCKYLHDGKEIIGDRFEVIQKLNLNDIQDVGKLCEIMIAQEKKKYDVEIETLKKEITYLENAMVEETRTRECLIYENKMNIRIKWLWLFMGIMLGVILQGLFQ